ncbi:MAG: hypothetical protein LBD24_08375 [Spirochaetaceae bacterium]|nr:hypothetical protein [Spirochaetaceae bacterium]
MRCSGLVVVRGGARLASVGGLGELVPQPPEAGKQSCYTKCGHIPLFYF